MAYNNYMATTIKESFVQYASRLEITERQETIVGNCRTNVVKSIKNRLTLHGDESCVIGSWDRNTLIRYLKEGDVDVMVILNYGKNSHWDNAQGTILALNKFYSILKTSYPDTEMVVDENCVTLKLAEFKLDVVPAFKFNDGSFSIPDTRRQAWIKTDPIKFQKLLTMVNKNMSNDFVPLIKMVKGWDREQKWPIKSFHLECIMYKHYKSYTKSFTYDSMLRVFFNRLPEYLNEAIYDPVTNDRVDTYLNVGDKRSKAVEMAKKAAEKAEEAFKDEEKYPIVAIGEWKDLLGEFFPTYG